MGATTVDLTGSDETGDNDPAELEREVEDIRDNIDGIVSELDRRRHELFDWRMQLRKHALLFAAVGAGCLLGLGLTITLGVVRRRRERRFWVRAGRLREALSRVIAHPELVSQPQPGVGKKALTAAASAGASILAKTLAQRLADATESTPRELARETQ
jgi:hypothetical protein